MWDYVSGDIMNVDGKIVFDCMQQGDESAKKVFNLSIFHQKSAFFCH